MAIDFARVGCRVGIAARRSEPLGEVKSLYPSNVAAMTIDVTAPDAVKRFYDLIELIDGMDIFINAAGTGFADPDLDDSRISTTMRTNVDDSHGSQPPLTDTTATPPTSARVRSRQ